MDTDNSSETPAERLLDAVLAHVPFDGWSETSFRAAIADSGVTDGLARALYPRGGIDLALALVEDDLGAEVARMVAQALVVHQRRPGGQSQFSALIDLGGRTGRFGPLMDWARANLALPLTVEQLADQAAMSPRNFARAFVVETSTTPAKAVERLRLEAARAAVENGFDPIDRIAEAVGFGDPERMRRAFLRAFGLPPQALRRSARS